MSTIDEGYLILDSVSDGSHFRPSNWVERIASSYASFSQQRIHYHPMIRPYYTEGERGLFIAAALAEINAQAYDFVINFAQSNGLLIQPIGYQHSYSTAA